MHGALCEKEVADEDKKLVANEVIVIFNVSECVRPIVLLGRLNVEHSTVQHLHLSKKSAAVLCLSLVLLDEHLN